MNDITKGQIDLLPLYVSHKEVRATAILEVSATYASGACALLIKVGDDEQTFETDAGFASRAIPEPGDMLVIYGDGYQSWSPRDVFGDGYSLVEPVAAEPVPAAGETVEGVVQETAPAADPAAAAKPVEEDHTEEHTTE